MGYNYRALFNYHAPQNTLRTQTPCAYKKTARYAHRAPVNTAAPATPGSRSMPVRTPPKFRTVCCEAAKYESTIITYYSL